MVKLTTRARGRLPKAKFACPENAPGSGSYPIDTRARVSSAKAYYQRENTTKCRNGKKRICKAAKKMGMMKPSRKSGRTWIKWCGL